MSLVFGDWSVILWSPVHLRQGQEGEPCRARGGWMGRLEMVIIDNFKEMWLRRGKHSEWYQIEVKEVLLWLPVGEASCCYDTQAPGTGPGTW